MMILSVLMPVVCTGQVFDDFSDGDILGNPPWYGDRHAFIVNTDHALQLDAEGAGKASLYTPTATFDSMEWEIDITMDFAPSDANRLRIYLLADSIAGLSGGNAYFLQIGENGASDGLLFFKQINGNPLLLERGGDGLFSMDPAGGRIRVTKTVANVWSVYTDPGYGNHWTLLMELTESSLDFVNPGFFGIVCDFSASRNDRFFFDNILVREIMPDTTGPGILSVKAVSSNRLELEMTESLLQGSLSTTAFEVTPGIGAPASVESKTPSDLVLTFAMAFQSGASYALSARDLTDVNGNVTTEQRVPFTFLDIQDPKPYMLLINEVMADPSPPVALPPEEYVELFNASGEYISLHNLQFGTRSKTVPLPNIVVNPMDLVILTKPEAAPAFEPYGAVIPLPGFPALPNSGTRLYLTDPVGNLIHTFQYDQGAYQNNTKDDGGWSLELIAPSNPCVASGNITASLAWEGGTPGKTNSVLADQPDTSGPRLTRVFPISPTAIRMYFDKYLNPQQDSMYQHIALTPDVSFHTWQTDPWHPNQATLHMDQPGLQDHTPYTLHIPAVTDCIGHPFFNQSIPFGLPEPMDSGDIVINELLFDPETGGAQFVEIFNRSNQYLNAADMIFAEILGDTVDAEPVVSDFLMAPQQYYVFTSDTADLHDRYHIKDRNLLIENPMPAISRSDGNITVYRAGHLLEAFNYSEEMHLSFLRKTKGVSLERLSPDVSADIPANWASAAETSGFATPGYQNSQYQGFMGIQTPFEIQNRTFSPDGDGHNDALMIRFPVQDFKGMIATITIFDEIGRWILDLARGTSIGGDSLITWDGRRADGSRADIGIYIILIDLLAPDGARKKYKEPCVLALRFQKG